MQSVAECSHCYSLSARTLANLIRVTKKLFTRIQACTYYPATDEANNVRNTREMGQTEPIGEHD